MFKRVSLESGQTFTLVSPDLSVPGVSSDVLQRVISQANSASRLFASSPFCRLAGRGAFFCGFPLRWVLYIVLSLTRRVNVHDATPCSREDSLYECGRPCDALCCLFFSSALWLQSNQSILVQETRSAKDVDLTCFKTFPIKAATCLQVGLTSLDWPVDPFARFDHSRSSLSPEFPCDGQQRGALPASSRSRWRQNTLQAPPQVLQRITGWDGCGPFLFWRSAVYYLEHQGSHWVGFFKTAEQRIQTQISQEVLCHKKHPMSPGGTWKRRVSPGY